YAHPRCHVITGLKFDAHSLRSFQNEEDIQVSGQWNISGELSLLQHCAEKLNVIDPQLIDDVALVLLEFVLFSAFTLKVIDGIGKLMRFFLCVLAAFDQLLPKCLQPTLRALP